MAKAALKTKVKPLGENVLVRRLKAEEKTAGGIVLPDAAKEKPKEGVIIALGDGKLLDNGSRCNFSVKLKDRVLVAGSARAVVISPMAFDSLLVCAPNAQARPSRRLG